MLIVLIYAVFSALWILLSDTALKGMIQDAEKFAIISVLKAYLFVAVTSLLLYGLLQRSARRQLKIGAGSATLLSRPSHWLIFTLLALCLVGVSIGGLIFHWRQQEELARLRAIAELKTAQITEWLAQRQREAEYVRSNAYLTELFRRWLEIGDIAASTKLRPSLDQFGQTMGFSAEILFDPQAHKLWSSLEMSREVPPSLLAAVQVAANDHSIQRIGPYRTRNDRLHLDFVVPIAVGGGTAATVVLHTDPADWLYATIQKWPGPSPSGETLIFRRDGDDVLYLNELRHRQDAATRLRLPITSPDLMASQLAKGDAHPGEL